MNILERKYAQDKWIEILTKLAPELGVAIAKRPSHVPCPSHGGEDGLRAFDDFEKTGGMVCNTCGAFPDGIQVLQWINGWTCEEAIKNITLFLQNYSTAPLKTVNLNDNSILNQILAEAIPLCYEEEVKPALKYFKKRGIRQSDYPDVLMFHPSLEYWEDGKMMRYPAIIAEIEREHEVVSVQRIYLTQAGDKAPVSHPKKLIPALYKGATSGAAVRLYPPGNKLAVAEGIETALAVFESVGTPVWAAVSSVGLSNLHVPEHVQSIDIWADKDRSGAGYKAAVKLADRLVLDRKKVRIIIPPGEISQESKSKDWLDVLNEE